MKCNYGLAPGFSYRSGKLLLNRIAGGQTGRLLRSLDLTSQLSCGVRTTLQFMATHSLTLSSVKRTLLHANRCHTILMRHPIIVLAVFQNWLSLLAKRPPLSPYNSSTILKGEAILTTIPSFFFFVANKWPLLFNPKVKSFQVSVQDPRQLTRTEIVQKFIAAV